jgi:hypothetical protein
MQICDGCQIRKKIEIDNKIFILLELICNY